MCRCLLKKSDPSKSDWLFSIFALSYKGILIRIFGAYHRSELPEVVSANKLSLITNQKDCLFTLLSYIVFSGIKTTKMLREY